MRARGVRRTGRGRRRWYDEAMTIWDDARVLRRKGLALRRRIRSTDAWLRCLRSLHRHEAALNAIDILDDKTAGAVEEIRALPRTAPSVHSRAKNYAVRLLDKILSDL